MLTKEDIQKILNGCHAAAKQRLESETKHTLESLQVDFLVPPSDFLGKTNPAIFINHHTFNLLGKFHPSWIENQTIAVRENFLENPPLMIVGILVHETGHAFNVAAKIENSEANAYLFEIETLTLWYKAKNALLFDCSETELLEFLQARLQYYRMGISNNACLASLVTKIEQKTILTSPESRSPVFFQNSSSERLEISASQTKTKLL